MEKKIINILKNFLKNKNKSLHSPIFFGNEKKYLLNCIKTTYVSSVGQYVKKFEDNISKYTKVKNTVALINGSSALFLLLKALGIGKKDEVLIPSLTFIATANAVFHAGADPNFVDVGENSFCICPNKLENYLLRSCYIFRGKTFNKKTNKQIKAIILVYLFGFAEQVEKIKRICKKFNLILLEDAAEAIGSYYKKKHLGTFGDAGVISFNGNKTITCGNGAVVITKNKKLAKKVRHLSVNAKINHPYEYIHNDYGYNFRLSNINAAIGCAQLENITTIIKLKRKNFAEYKKKFSLFKKISIVSEPKNCISNYWLINLDLNKFHKIKNRLLKKLNFNSIKARALWKPLHQLKIFNYCSRDNLKNTEQLYSRVISLPSSPSLFK